MKQKPQTSSLKPQARTRYGARGLRFVAYCLLLVHGPALAQLAVCGQQVPVYRMAGTDYVSLAGLVQACNGKFWRIAEQGPTDTVLRFVVVLPRDSRGAWDTVPTPTTESSHVPVPRPEREYVFWVDSAVVRCADREIVLPLAPKLDGEQLYVPVLALAAFLPEFSPAMPNLTLAGVFEAGDTAMVRLDVQGRKPGELPVWHGEMKSGLEYQLAVGAKCDSQATEQIGLVPMLASKGLVQSVRMESGAGAVLLFTFRRPANTQAVADSAGLVLRFWPKPTRRVHTIVLDPGHGGEDPGAIGVTGTQEKIVVLDVAMRLKARLEADGFEVLLTRSCDTLVPLSDRSKIANTKRADLFVSIHANAAPNRQACGLETYFLSESKTDWERTVAARENAALEFETTDAARMTDELELILTDLAQNEFLYESSELAAKIQEMTLPLARVNNRGVRQANFYVLRNNYMPAVLVECGFLTNRSEEKLLNDSKHRDRLAEGIAKGIVEFTKEYEKRVNGN